MTDELVDKVGSDRGGGPVRWDGRPLNTEEFRLPFGFDPADDGRGGAAGVAQGRGDGIGDRFRHRRQQAARGLRVAEQKLFLFGNARRVVDPIGEELPVGAALSPRILHSVTFASRRKASLNI